MIEVRFSLRGGGHAIFKGIVKIENSEDIFVMYDEYERFYISKENILDIQFFYRELSQ